MGLVSLEPVLFNDTIRAGIAYGKDGNASEAEIRAGPIQRHNLGLVGNVGLIFTKGDLKEVSEEVAKYKMDGNGHRGNEKHKPPQGQNSMGLFVIRFRGDGIIIV